MHGRMWGHVDERSAPQFSALPMRCPVQLVPCLAAAGVVVAGWTLLWVMIMLTTAGSQGQSQGQFGREKRQHNCLAAV